jgi:hypothetical protein
MRLALSAAAGRDASPRELAAGCVRRGLEGIELDAAERGLRDAEPPAAGPLEVSAAVRLVGLDVCGLYRRGLHSADVPDAARLAAAVGAPLVVPVAGLDRSLLPLASEAFGEVGAELLLAHGGDPRVVEAIRWLIEPMRHNGAIGLAWEIRPGLDDPARMPDVLEAAGHALRYVRLFGGGPEAGAQAGMGIGGVIARLTLARFSGPLVLTPSHVRYHHAWNAWLGRSGGWGCGSKHSNSSTPGLSSTARPTLELR